MIRAYRILKTSLAQHAFDGEGARLYGGRWNSKGRAVVYCAESLSLATLEILVHLEDRVSLENLFSFIAVDIPDECVEVLPLSDLPLTWNSEAMSSASRQVGDEWVAEGRTVALKVPSAIIPNEWNYLLNPAHPDFSKLAFGFLQSFSMDPRLVS